MGNRDSVLRLLDYLKNVGNVMKAMIALRKTEDEVIKAGGAVKYYPSGTGSAHISTLKKWHRIWRARVE